MDPYINQLNQLVKRIEILSEELEVAEALIESLIGDETTDLNEEVIVEAKKWIQKAIKKPGALRKSLKVKAGKDIPASKLKKAAEKGGKMGKRARLALTLRKLNEESNNPLHRELEQHMSVIGKHGMMLHNTDHPDRYKFGKAWVEFSQGKFNNADELIKMGADASAVGNYIKVRSSPEFAKEQEGIKARITPEDMGYGEVAKRRGGWTGD